MSVPLEPISSHDRVKAHVNRWLIGIFKFQKPSAFRSDDHGENVAN